MKHIDEHIKNIASAINIWLRPDNGTLKEAIDRTVDENLFSFEDVKHQIRHLKQSVNKNTLNKWIKNVSLNSLSSSEKNVVCLHAGNLPLVGFQDLLSVTMTGADYTGKISRKDPYLLPTLLETLDELKVLGERKWSISLSELSHAKADALIFAGSEDSVDSVLEKLMSLKIADEKTPKLMRTAHFSIAFITNHDQKTMENLSEAVFRYGGTGCRSVAVVIAPFSLNSQKCHFTDYAEIFWLKNPQHKKPDKNLFYRYATNKSVDISQAWLDDYLIEETFKYPNEKFVLHWVQGDGNTLNRIIDNFQTGLQTVYTEDGLMPESLYSKNEIQVDKLENAQTPEIWWKPDGIDSIQWLNNQLK